MQMATPEMISTKEASEVVCKTIDWLIRARRRPGDGPPYYKLGGRIYYRVPELMTWLRSNRRE